MYLGPIREEWFYEKVNQDGEVIYTSPIMTNLHVDDGRELVLQFLAGMTGTSAGSAVVYLMVGASSTAADYTDERLWYEYNNNTNRITATNSSGGSFTSADIEHDPVTISGVTYRKKLRFKFAISATNNLDGLVIQEAGLNTEQATPGSPSTKHGVMLNRLVVSPAETKEAGVATSFYMDLRF